MPKTENVRSGSEREILRGYVTENFLLSSGKDTFDDDDSFMENGIIDSTGILELLEFLEERFGIKIEDEEIIPDNLDSIDKMTSFIQKKKENARK